MKRALIVAERMDHVARIRGWIRGARAEGLAYDDLLDVGADVGERDWRPAVGDEIGLRAEAFEDAVADAGDHPRRRCR